jgi:hypothetical protein
MTLELSASDAHRGALTVVNYAPNTFIIQDTGVTQSYKKVTKISEAISEVGP